MDHEKFYDKNKIYNILIIMISMILLYQILKSHYIILYI